MLGPVVEGERDGDGQRVEDEHRGEEDGERDEQCAPRLLELAWIRVRVRLGLELGLAAARVGRTAARGRLVRVRV